MIKFEGIDLYCGAGGVTTGIKQAQILHKKIAKVIACINHEENAILSHKANHRFTKHFTEDIRNFDVTKLPLFIRKEDVYTYIWASFECTNHSNAKGGLSREADSRTQANDLFKYFIYLGADYLLLENVREFLEWGPLVWKGNPETGELYFDKKGKPILMPDKKRKGEYFEIWKNKVIALGYDFEFRILNSADYGERTSRKRLYIIFAKQGLPIFFQPGTYSKKGGKGFKKWRAVKQALDLHDKGENLFDRKKNIGEKSLKRVYEGAIKFVAGGKEAFLQQYNGGINRVLKLDGPCNTVTTCNRFALVQSEYLIKYFGHGLNAVSTDIPSPTLTTKDRLALIQTENYIVDHHGNSNSHSIEDPSKTITTKDHYSIISVEKHLLDNQYGTGKVQDIEVPAGAIVCIPKQKLVTAQWLMDTSYNNIGTSTDKPAGTILASRKQHYLMNPQYYSKGSSIEDPCFTLIAKMDKRPPYLITLESGEVAIEIFESDSYYTRKIKEFMALYGIVAFYMRMLKIPELLRIQGFPDTYILKGSKAQQKKYIGNAVTPKVVKAIFEGLHFVLTEMKEVKEAA